MNKKIVLIFLGCICIVFLILLLYREDILNMFRKSESLNYNKEVSYIIIFARNNPDLAGKNKEIKLDDKEKIESFINYVNSLELIEKEKIPNDRNFQNNGHFSVHIYGKDSVFGEDVGVLDSFQFSTYYLTIFRNGYDWEHTDYYIKDSGYNSKDKSNKISQYLYNLLYE